MIAERKSKAPCRKFTGSSFNAVELAASPSLELAYIVAAPRMAYYMTYSTRIYDIYLKYIAPEDLSLIHIFVTQPGWHFYNQDKESKQKRYWEEHKNERKEEKINPK